jgi:adenylosuccinate lyase
MLCTSEDVNNIVYQVSLRNATNDVILSKLRAILQPLVALIDAYKSDAILGRTHGQVAVPTTFGKLIAVELNTLATALEPLTQLVFSGKFSGATGSNVDHNLTFSDVDWINYEKRILEKF